MHIHPYINIVNTSEKTKNNLLSDKFEFSLKLLLNDQFLIFYCLKLKKEFIKIYTKIITLRRVGGTLYFFIKQLSM